MLHCFSIYKLTDVSTDKDFKTTLLSQLWLSVPNVLLNSEKLYSQIFVNQILIPSFNNLSEQEKDNVAARAVIDRNIAAINRIEILITVSKITKVLRDLEESGLVMDESLKNAIKTREFTPEHFQSLLKEEKDVSLLSEQQLFLIEQLCKELNSHSFVMQDRTTEKRKKNQLST